MEKGVEGGMEVRWDWGRWEVRDVNGGDCRADGQCESCADEQWRAEGEGRAQGVNRRPTTAETERGRVM